MYDPTVSAKQIETAAQALRENFARQGVTCRVEPEYHSVQDCQRNARALADLINIETGALVRDLHQDEQEWIVNERLLSQWDANYWCTHYACILNWENQIQVYTPNIAQRIGWDIHAEMERNGFSIMEQALKARQLGKCLAPETRVLTADLRWITLEEIEPGQEIVSVDEFGDGRKDRRLRRATVISKWDVHEPAFRLVMDNGEVLIATGQHRFLCLRQMSRDTRAWKTVSQIRVGDGIRYVTQPWSAPDYEDGWFAGMLDGEGCLRGKKTGGAEICVAQVLNGAYARASEYLKSRGYSFRVDMDNRKSADSSIGDKPVAKLVVSRINEVFRLVGQTRPTRFIGRPWWEGKGLPGKKSGAAWSVVVAIEPLGVRRMIDLQTSTKTFIAEGFVSHNSTDTELKVAHRVQFHPYVNAVIASARPDRSLKMAQMMERCWNHQPWFLMPRRGAWSTGDVPGLMEFSDLHSVVAIQHGAQKMGIARGDTPTVGHLSECAEFEDPEELIEAALLNAVHESPWVFMVFEGTGAGKNNWWYRNWQFIKANWPLGRSRLRPTFLPWYVGRDIYPTETWLRMHPVPRNWEPEESTNQHAGKAKDYVAANDLLRKYLGNGWQMPREQMWWWEVTRAEHKAKGKLSLFLQECCADDIEAFQSHGNSVCDTEIITAYTNRIKEPIGVFGLRAPAGLVDPKFQPQKWEINHDLPTIKVDPDRDLTLVPLKYQGISTVDPNGKIFIWEFPDNNEEYGLGVDPSNGVGADRSVIEVFRKGTIQRNDAQVAEFATPYLNAAQILPWCHALAKLYSRGEKKQAKLVIEQTCGGNILQLDLRKMGWSNFHIDLRGYNQKIIDRAKMPNVGWHMHAAARDGLITKLLEFLRSFLVDINSPWFVEEMGELQANELTQKIAAEKGAHDDRIMGGGMVLFSLHDLESRTRMPSIAKQRAEASAEEFSSPRYIPGWQEAGAPAGEAPLYQFDLEDSWTQ